MIDGSSSALTLGALPTIELKPHEVSARDLSRSCSAEGATLRMPKAAKQQAGRELSTSGIEARACSWNSLANARLHGSVGES